jgi:phosphoribosylformylglycinamidine synthase
VLHICKQWDVTAAVVGKVIKEQIIRVFLRGQKILEMDLEFMTGGPVYDECARPVSIKKQEIAEKNFPMPDVNKILQKVLSSPNIASKEWVIRQYDHEVRGNTVIKPLQGKLGLETHGDSTVLKPLEDSWKGLAVTADVNPRFMERDPYWGAMSAVDEACRNLVAVGAAPDSLLDCLNFGNPEKPERMGEFYEACRGLGDIGRALDLPYVSGNVSFYNESVKTAVPPTPEIFAVGIVDDIRTCITSDFKTEGNLVYLVGKQTDKELGGSEYYNMMKIEGGIVPKTDPDILRHCMKGLLTCMKKQYVVACHDLSEGGLGACLAEMAIGGDLGVIIDVSMVGKDLRTDFKVFSESNTRWVVEVKKEKQTQFEKQLEKDHVSFILLGTTKGGHLIIKDHAKTVVDLSVDVLRECWRKPIWDFMG